MKEKQIKIHNNILIAIIVLSIISSLRVLFTSLKLDELTYYKVSENLLQGKYNLKNHPSSVAPAIPFVFSIFTIKSYPLLGFILNRIFNICLVGFGFYYIVLFLKKQKIKKLIILCILALVAVNPNSVAWFGTLYPESLIFFSFWGFIYYASQPAKRINLIKMLCFFTLIVFTRYVYAVLGLVVLINYYDYLKENFNKYSVTIIKYSLLFLIPFLFWGKYILNVEEQNLSEISYFERYKIDNPILYNIKCGLGLEKHHEVDKINGIPAFASLFIPITGFRNYTISLILIFGFICGLIKHIKRCAIKKLLIATVLIMFGFILAGTGFSRYWLMLLPAIYLGYFYLFKMLNINNKWFIYASQIISLVYIVNEVRIDILVIERYF
ncbi:hypothetical protein FPF71_14925 [Algibacter amylolyticus]|uniref:Glycosyltransferase RgtA/B/C/D-like domain-containing protein n=1 Tax=Algibacter amylolyticus TaxID=1608400 RepID=A0A5M7B558_9FLAO|nr:hypothetical protein [Algibacter amylolyticus]KAA5822435.1 hypothetical protein F2B50_14925 [Algibacter amylolyticus]MBB5269158.1 hypothetical protein [Algibacter amylolyticus]TSJ73585.1 hypothetical protein FPF71_14925 [Algibacter amylolyticus]